MNVCRAGSCAGEYTLTGVWVSETQTWALSPRVWLTNPCNYTMLGFSGTIDVVAGLRRFSGRVVGGFGVLCSTFSLMESTGTSPSSCASSETLILGIPTVSNSLARTILSGTYHTLWYCMVTHSAPCDRLAPTSAPTLVPNAADPNVYHRLCRPPKPIVGTADGQVVLQGYCRVLQGFVLPRRVTGLNQ
jgi:hypothetical protein